MGPYYACASVTGVARVTGAACVASVASYTHTRLVRRQKPIGLVAQITIAFSTIKGFFLMPEAVFESNG